MNETPKSALVTPEKREVEIPFPLAKELFAFAQESGLGESSYSEKEPGTKWLLSPIQTLEKNLMIGQEK